MAGTSQGGTEVGCQPIVVGIAGDRVATHDTHCHGRIGSCQQVIQSVGHRVVMQSSGEGVAQSWRSGQAAAPSVDGSVQGDVVPLADVVVQFLRCVGARVVGIEWDPRDSRKMRAPRARNQAASRAEVEQPRKIVVETSQ